MIVLGQYRLSLVRAASVEGLHAALNAGQLGLNPGNKCLVLAIISIDDGQLRTKMNLATQLLGDASKPICDPENGIFFEPQPFGADSLAFVFPGQGSQYAGMLSGYLALNQFADAAAEYERIAQPIFSRSLQQSVLATKGAAADATLVETRAAQAAIGYVSAVMARTLGRFGVKPKLAAGHSYGELVALWQVGALDDATLLHLTERRGHFMAEAAQKAPGGMAAVAADETRVSQLLQGVSGVEIANLNTHKQTIVAGHLSALEQVGKVCEAQDVRFLRLTNTAAAFHTSSMAPALIGWRTLLQQYSANGQLQNLKNGRVVANVTANDYPPDGGDAIADLLTRQIASRVRWRESCERLYHLGARIFVEVGPGQVLTRTLGQNLGQRPHLALCTDPKNTDAPLHLARLLAQLAVHGVVLDQTMANNMTAHMRPKMNTDIELGQIVRDYFSENGKLVERYFGLAEKIIENAPAQALAEFLTQSKQIVSEHLVSHERALELVAAKPQEPVLPAAMPMAKTAPRAFLSNTHSAPIDATQNQAALIQAAPVSTAASNTHSNADLEQWFRTEISRVTGFPPESIDLSAPFEEMGIDSLAYTELFQRLTTQFPAARSMAKALFNAQSANAILALLQNQQNEQNEQNEASHTSSPTTQDKLENWLRAEISRVTGFPASSIELSARFDDLGIDSLAFTELFQRFTQSFAIPRDQAKLLFAAKSVGDILATLGNGIEAPTRAVAATAKQTAPSSQAGPDVTEAAPTSDQVAAPDEVTQAGLSPTLFKMREKMFALIRALRASETFELTENTRFSTLGLNNFEREVLWKSTVLTMSPYTLAGEVLMATESIGEALELLQQLEPSSTPSASTDALCRYVQADVTRPLPSTIATPKKVLLIGAPNQDLQHFQDGFKHAGIEVLTLVLNPNGWDTPDGRHIPMAADDELAACLAQLCQPVAGMPILFLTADNPTTDTHHADSLIADVDRNAVGLFVLAKALSTPACAGHGDLGVILCSGLAPATVAARGVARALSHEWHEAGIGVSSLMLDGKSPVDPVLALSILMAFSDSHDLELRDGKLIEKIELPTPVAVENLTVPLSHDSVVVLFGGGVGIGAEIGVDLATRYKSIIVALGRTSWDGTTPWPEADTDAKLGEAVYADLKSKAGRKKVATSDLQAATQLARRRRALAETASRVRAAGGRFEYLCADVTNAHDIERAIARIQKNIGKIDGVVHAAGIVEDKLLAAKSVESFRRVLHTKANSALYLQQALQALDLKFVVFFSSMTAHTGNAGQTDYCAANEVLNAVAHNWSLQDKGARIVSMLWSVWTETGLAARGVQGLFERNQLAGVSSIEGTRYFHEELSASTPIPWALITSPRTLKFMRRELAA